MKTKAIRKENQLGLKIQLPIPLQEFRNASEGSSGMPGWHIIQSSF